MLKAKTAKTSPKRPMPTDDHNDEVVLTLVVRVESCDEDVDAQLDDLRSQLSIARY